MIENRFVDYINAVLFMATNTKVFKSCLVRPLSKLN